MKYLCFLIFCAFLHLTGYTQTNSWWEHTALSDEGSHMIGDYSADDFLSAVDSVNGIVYVANIYNSFMGYGDYRLYKYDGVNWWIVADYTGDIYSMCVYQSNLYIGSNTLLIVDTMLNDFSPGYFVRYDGSIWESLDVDGYVKGLKVIDDTLYVGGEFSTINSEPFAHAAKYDGENWHQIPDNPFFDMPDYETVYSFAKYQDELYISGVSPNVNDEDLMYYHNGTWEAVGDGLEGLDTKVNFLEVYNGELYAAGIIRQDEGNVGNGIQKWNGETWSQVGDGLSSDKILDMQIFQDALYASGPIDSAGNVELNGIGRWDGTRWCGMQTYTTDQIIPGFFILNDNIFMPLMNSDSDPFFDSGSSDLEIYKWIGGDDFGPCPPLTSVNDKDQDKSFSIFPNPSNGLFTLTSEEPIDQITVYDLSGKMIIQNHTFQELDLSDFESGMYLIQVKIAEQLSTAKLIKF